MPMHGDRSNKLGASLLKIGNPNGRITVNLTTPSPSFASFRRFTMGIIHLTPAALLFLGGLGVAGAQVTAPAGYSFGTVTLGQSAATTVTFNFTGTVSVASISVVTQGAIGKDFQPESPDISSTLCTAKTYTSGQSCTVDVSFSPLLPGNRQGAAILRNSSSQIIATGYVTGFGSGANLGFGGPTVSTYAGIPGSGGYNYTSGIQATSNKFGYIRSITMDGNNNLYIADGAFSLIWKVAPNGTVSILLGTKGSNCNTYTPSLVCPYPTSNSTTLASSSYVDIPQALAVDGAGQLWFEDDSLGTVATIDLATGYITGQVAGYSGVMGAPATSGNIHSGATLGYIWSLVPDGLGNIYAGTFYDGISSTSYGLIEKIDSAGSISVVAGNGAQTPVPTEGASATAVGILLAYGMGFDGSGNLFYFDQGDDIVFKIDTSSKVHVVAGTGSGSPDNTASLPYWLSGTASTTASTSLNLSPYAGLLTVDPAGNVYFPNRAQNCCSTNHASDVLVFPPSGNAYILFGNATMGDVNGPASSAEVAFPNAITLDNSGNVYVGEYYMENPHSVYVGAAVREYSLPSAPSLTFAAQPKGSTSAGQTVSATNYGNAPLVLTTPSTGTNPSVSSGFSLPSDTAYDACSSGNDNSLAIGDECSISVAFSPNVSSSTVNGTLTYSGNLASGSKSYAISGTAAAGVASLAMTGLPSSTASGASNTVTVTAYDGSSNIFTAYTGTVTFSLTNSDPAASLPSSYTFTASDNGTKTFSVTLSASGPQTANVADTLDSLTASQSTTVSGGTSSAAAIFNGTETLPGSYTSIFNAQMNSTDNVEIGDGVSSTKVGLDPVSLNGGPAYSFSQYTQLSVSPSDFNGVGIDDSQNIYNCYYEFGDIRIEGKSPNGSGGYTTPYNIYYSGGSPTASARCIATGPGTVYLAPGDGTLQIATPSGSTFALTVVTGAPTGVVGLTTGYNGALLLSTGTATYAGTIGSGGAWTGTQVASRGFYKFAAYQDSSGNVYLEDASTQAGYQYTLSGSSYTQSSWTKPFGVTAVSYSSNSGGSLLVAAPTNAEIQFSPALVFPAINVGTADPTEELVLKFTVAGTLSNVSVAGSNSSTDFTDAGTGSCTTNGTSHTYAIGDLCTIDVTFTPTQKGTRTGTAQVKDASGNVIATASLTGIGVLTVNHLTFTSIPTSATVGSSFNVTVTAYEDAAGTTVQTADNDAVTVTSADSAALLPTNVVFASGVATFAVTLNTTPSQTITTTDTAESVSVTSSSITVNPGGDSTSTSVSASSSPIDLGQTVNLTATVKDTTTTSTVPAGGVTLSDLVGTTTTPLNGGNAVTLSGGVATLNGVTLSGTGTHTITATYAGVSGSFASSSNTTTVTVNSAVAATQAIASTALTQNYAATSFTPVTGSSGTTPFSYSVSPTLPTGLSMSSNTGAITGTPTATSSATTYTVTVKDATNATATATFSLKVNAAVTATQAAASTALTQNHAATSFTPVTGANGTTPLSYSVSPTLPTGLSMASATGAITGTPTGTSSATTYTVTVTDANDATATATFSLKVNTAVTATQAIANTVLTQNHAATSFTPVTGGGGTTPLSYSVSPTLPAGLSMASVTGAITGTPTATSAATSYTVTVTDSNGATAIASFSLTVNIAVTATQAVASTTLMQSKAATAFTPVTGGGGTGTLSYSVSPTLPTGLSMASGTGTISGAPSVSSTSTTYAVMVTDANGATATATFSLTVTGSVVATQAIPSTILTRNHAATAFTPITGSGGTGALSYSVSPNLPAGLSMASSTGTISGTPTATSSATTYTVTVTDTTNTTATATFGLAVNTAVTATQAIASTSLTQNHATSFTPVIGAGGTGSLSYSVSPTLPSGLSMASSTGAITGTPTAASSATSYTVTVTDTNGATATASFSLTVNAAITATQAIASTTLTQNHTTTPFVPVTGAGGTGTLNYSVSPTLPAGLSYSTTTGAITGNPTATSTATTYTVTVTDANSATATATFSLTVNSAVAATQAVTSTTLTQNHAATAFTPVTGSGGTSPLSYSVSPTLPGGLSYSTTTGAITGIPTATVTATTYTVTVTDANSATATATFSLTVNLAVTATTAGATTTLTDNVAATSFTPVRGSGGTGTLSYGVSPALPSGLSYSTTTGAITGTPTATSTATTYTVTVTDNNGATATATFSLMIVVVPTTAVVSAVSTPYGSTAGIVVTATEAGSAGAVTGGVVTFGTAGSVGGSFSPATCTLTSAGTCTTTYTPSGTLSAGTYPSDITVSFAATGNYTVASGTATLTVTQMTPAVSLVSSANAVLVQNSVTLTATVSSSSGAPANGDSVTFYDNTASAALGKGTLAAGVATFTTSTLAIGTHSITAIFGGDTNFVTATSPAVSELVEDFSLNISTTSGSVTSVTVVPGATATYLLTISPTGASTFPAIVNLTATGLPPGATYTLTPSSLASGSGTTNVTLVINVPVNTAMNHGSPQDQRLNVHLARNLAPMALALLLLPFTRRMRRASKRMARMLSLLLLLAVGMVGAAGLSACGSTSTGFFGQAPQTYTISVTGTSGPLTHSTTVTLTVE